MSSSQNPKLMVILGPTASGKTEWGIKLAQKYNGEIISADSRQMYKGMDIGTAKPINTRTIKQLNNKAIKYETKDNSSFQIPAYIIDTIPHYLFNVVNPDQDFTVAHFKEIAEYLIQDIHVRKKIPLIVGGTGFYISAVVDNLIIPHVEPNKVYRKDLENKIKNKEVTAKTLYKKLISIDPDAAHFVEPHNARRIIRALEVIHTTGKKISRVRKKGPQKYDCLQVGIKAPPGELEKKINNRVDRMIKTGLIREVENLLKKYPSDLPALSGIGYREIIDYLEDKISLEKSAELIKLHTRQFAKRQMKWFMRDNTIQWIELYTEAEQTLNTHLTSGSANF